MKDFITIADEAIERMGKAPYDDKKTREYIKKITKRTIDEHE